jgi:hypothetical protein
MPPTITQLPGSGRVHDRSAALRDALMDCIVENGDGMPYAAVIGVLEIIKIQLLIDSVEGDEQ